MPWWNSPWIRKIVSKMVKENAISGTVRFRIFPAARAHRLTAMQQPKAQSFPAISGMLMAAAMYKSFVKGCTPVSQVLLSTYKLILFMV